VTENEVFTNRHTYLPFLFWEYFSGKEDGVGKYELSIMRDKVQYSEVLGFKL
jgi:hypothetical protein